MNTEAIVQTLLRLLPSIVIASLGFVAAADAKTRARWAELLYQAGSLRPEQRTDPKVRDGVKMPFFLVAAVFLIWPILYYRYATHVIEINPDFLTAKPVSPLMQSAPKTTPATSNAVANSATLNTNAAPAPAVAPTPVSSSPLFSTTPAPTPAPAAPTTTP